MRDPARFSVAVIIAWMIDCRHGYRLVKALYFDWWEASLSAVIAVDGAAQKCGVSWLVSRKSIARGDLIEKR